MSHLSDMAANSQTVKITTKKGTTSNSTPTTTAKQNTTAVPSNNAPAKPNASSPGSSTYRTTTQGNSGNKTTTTKTKTTTPKTTTQKAPASSPSPAYDPEVGYDESSMLDEYGRPYDDGYGYDNEYYDRLEEMYQGNNTAYDRALEEQRKATAAAIEKAKGDINAQKDTVSKQYADTARQLYINNMNSKKNIGQQMAAAGQTGGLAESTLLGIDTAYDENLRQGEQAKASALTDLDKAAIDAELAGSAQNAQAAADTALSKANAYAQVLQALGQRQDNIVQQQAAQRTKEQEYAFNIAMTVLQKGSMPTDATLQAAGLSKADAAAILAGNVKTAKSTSGGSKTTTPDTAWNAYLNGDRSAATISALESYYGIPIEQIVSSYGLGTQQETEPVQENINAQPWLSQDFSGTGAVQTTRSNNAQTIAQRVNELLNSSSRVAGAAAARSLVEEAWQNHLIEGSQYANLLNHISSMQGGI